ncbi:hypothetical protein CDD80_5838 [Ophiocordyceps camponoti-rufipedis]|uniref:Uncharacterized protein n=1 Tax=Ophiocordyceps camponoti-rufipedis TaxID=2004952 RepID=A0A2C5YS53_9HYPO|nr:hypothetical protein CDD80_5838 [Ophiocordyceps camponoti-rufipedis]
MTWARVLKSVYQDRPFKVLVVPATAQIQQWQSGYLALATLHHWWLGTIRSTFGAMGLFQGTTSSRVFDDRRDLSCECGIGLS